MATLRLAGAREIARTVRTESGSPTLIRALEPVPATPPAQSPALRCLNCDEELGGDFCQRCGQAAKVRRFTMQDFVREVFRAFELEHALPRTLIGILTRPGATIRAYLDGKRVSAYSPVNLLVLCGGLVALATISLDLTPKSTQPSSALIFRAVEIATQYRAYFVLLILPLDAVAPWFFLRRTGRGYAEQLAAAALVAAGSAVIGLAFVPLLWIAKHTRGSSTVDSIQSLVTVVYMTWAYATMQTAEHGTRVRRWSRGATAALGTYVMYCFAAIVMVFGLFTTIALSQLLLHQFGVPYRDFSFRLD